MEVYLFCHCCGHAAWGSTRYGVDNEHVLNEWIPVSCLHFVFRHFPLQRSCYIQPFPWSSSGEGGSRESSAPGLHWESAATGRTSGKAVRVLPEPAGLGRLPGCQGACGKSCRSSQRVRSLGLARSDQGRRKQELGSDLQALSRHHLRAGPARPVLWKWDRWSQNTQKWAYFWMHRFRFFPLWLHTHQAEWVGIFLYL